MSQKIKVIATKEGRSPETYLFNNLESAVKKRQQLLSSGKYVVVDILEVR